MQPLSRFVVFTELMTLNDIFWVQFLAVAIEIVVHPIVSISPSASLTESKEEAKLIQSVPPHLEHSLEVTSVLPGPAVMPHFGVSSRLQCLSSDLPLDKCKSMVLFARSWESISSQWHPPIYYFWTRR